MPYGVSKLALVVGQRVKVDPRRNGKIRDGEVTRDKPRISALTAGSIEWLIRVDPVDGLGDHGERWIEESLITVRK